MPLPPVRAVSLCVAAALAFIAAQARADAASSAVRVNLEFVDSLDIKRAQADDAASFASAERMEGSLADELELIGNAEVRRGGAVFTADRITYRHDTDEVTGKGNARISRAGASFSGPSMRFRITSREGSMDEAGGSTLREMYVDARKTFASCPATVQPSKMFPLQPVSATMIRGSFR